MFMIFYKEKKIKNLIVIKKKKTECKDRMGLI
jgi:hypothetical protein